MARLGELLVAAGLLDADKLEQALRAQVVWGGRLGTNLIELGFIDLDELSRALGRQHTLPAALARHFEKADPALQQTLAPELAARHLFVPLLALAEGKIAIAGMDPLDEDAIAEIAAALRCPPEDVIVSVAAEQRMRYQLERVYGIARGARYLRSRGKTIPPFQFGDFDSEADSEVEVDIPITWDEDPPPPPTPPPPPPTTRTPTVEPDALAAMIDSAIATTPSPATDDPRTGRDRRSYVKTLGDAPDSQPIVEKPAEKKQAALGRIAIRKVAVGPNGPEAVRDADTIADAARGIRRGGHRDRVAELVIDALTRFTPTCEAAMLLVIRGGTAIAWKHFCRSGATPAELAVPLEQAGLVPRAVDRATTMRGAAGALGPIDMLLLRALDKPDGELVIVPIAISGHVMCVIAIATEPDAVLPNVETIATSASTAFARLMRDASR